MRGRCLSWVNHATLTVVGPLPIFPDQQTFSGSFGMSQKCRQKLTSRFQPNGIPDMNLGRKAWRWRSA